MNANEQAKVAERDAQRFRDVHDKIKREVQRFIVGQEPVLDAALTALFAGGHVMLEGVPGLGKTMLVKSIGQAVDVPFSRIQFTPDMMPADIQGTNVLVETEGGGHELQFQEGPLVSSLVLADEINRATPRTQSALLEAMQERQISVGRRTIKLQEPYCVMATQNPVEQEGTYALPEAQVDRFLVKLVVGYPSKDEELKIIDRMAGLSASTDVQPATTPEELLKMRQLLDTIYLDDKVKGYIVDLVFATREPERVGLEQLKPLILYGASPRASLALARTARARAFLEGRGFVTPQDVKAVGSMVLRHRVLTTYEAEAEGVDSEAVLRTVFDTVPVP